MDKFGQTRFASGIIEGGAREQMAAAANLEDKFRAAFKEARDYWMTTDENIQFLGGVGAVMIHVGIDSPEYQRITVELDQLKTLNAALSGVAIDWEAAGMPDGLEPIGILKLWKESE